MDPVEFEPTISAGERPQTYALIRADTGSAPVVFTRGKNGGGMQLATYYYLEQRLRI